MASQDLNFVKKIWCSDFLISLCTFLPFNALFTYSLIVAIMLIPQKHICSTGKRCHLLTGGYFSTLKWQFHNKPASKITKKRDKRSEYTTWLSAVLVGHPHKRIRLLRQKQCLWEISALPLSMTHFYTYFRIKVIGIPQQKFYWVLMGLQHACQTLRL